MHPKNFLHNINKQVQNETSPDIFGLSSILQLKINYLRMKTEEVLNDLKRRFPNESEYHQAVHEVLESIEDVYNAYPEFEKQNLIERLCIPDRIFSFRVTWVDDKGNVQTNMAYRIQHNNAIGPYKGGMRFHASVCPSILKFLAFEQTF